VVANAAPSARFQRHPVFAAWTALLALVALAWPALVPAVDLVTGAERVRLSRELRYLHDPDETMTLADARVRAAEFAPVRRWPPTFGFAGGAHWFHLSVRNVDHADSDWVLAIRYPLLDHADLHVVRDDGTVARFEGGDRVPFGRREIAHRHPTYPVVLAPGERVELFLRVASESSVQVPLELATQRAFLEPTPREHLVLGVYYGILLGLFCYNLILFVSLRDRTFLLYVLHVALIAVAQLCLNGFAFQYLWPDSPNWANDAVLLAIAASTIAMIAFTRAFLELRTRLPFTDRVFVTIMIVLALIAVGIRALGYHLAVVIESGIAIAMTGAIFYAAVRVLLRGYRPARNFLIAWSALLLGIAAFASVSFGLLPKVFMTEYAIQLGSSAEMILLSFALAARINGLREENARIQREAQEQLEQRVVERTRDLDEANRQLQNVNRMLQDFSLRDGLTGAYNRRYFDQALTEQWAAAQAEHRPISLVMIDIDHFKHINDEHGHLFGDDCLRAVAHLLASQLEGADERVVRYGGEEFFAVLPGIDEAQALTRSERLRAAIAAMTVECGGRALRITASIGVATFHPDRALAHAELLAITDRALYEAKRQGRNRVVAATRAER